MPSDASLALRVRSAETEAGLADAEYRPLGTLSNANGNAACTAPDVDGCPIDPYEFLDGAPLAHHTFIEIEVTVTPTGNGSAWPTIDEWTLSYSCVDAR
jgi:hypothetical protein